MAKIFLNIEADSAEELREVMRGLAGVAGDFAVDYDDKGMPEVVERPTRVRRTKAQIAADEAAEKAASSNGAGSMEGGIAGRSLADQIKEATSDGPTLDDVKKLASEFVAKHSAAKAQDLIKEHTGATRMSEIPADKYGAAIQALEAAM